MRDDGVRDLVSSAQNGDADAFAGLYDHFYARIYRYVFFKTGNPTDAEDLAEEVFLKMLESVRSFKWQGAPFSSWLFRIAHNLVADHYRRGAHRKTAPLEAALGMVRSSSHDMESQMDLDLSIQRVYEAMKELTHLQQEVLTLRFAGGLSVQETSEAMKKKGNAVKALQHAAIKRLRIVLRPPLEKPARSVPQWSPQE